MCNCSLICLQDSLEQFSQVDQQLQHDKANGDHIAASVQQKAALWQQVEELQLQLTQQGKECEQLRTALTESLVSKQKAEQV